MRRGGGDVHDGAGAGVVEVVDWRRLRLISVRVLIMNVSVEMAESRGCGFDKIK